MGDVRGRPTNAEFVNQQASNGLNIKLRNEVDKQKRPRESDATFGRERASIASHELTNKLHAAECTYLPGGT